LEYQQQMSKASAGFESHHDHFEFHLYLDAPTPFLTVIGSASRTLSFVADIGLRLLPSDFAVFYNSST
jgi:hypothetical protein